MAAAEDKVKFAPGKKQNKFETLMTKEEIEEEQRSVLKFYSLSCLGGGEPSIAWT